MKKINLISEDLIEEFFGKETNVEVDELSKIVVIEDGKEVAHRVEAGDSVSLIDGVPTVLPKFSGVVEKEVEEEK